MTFSHGKNDCMFILHLAVQSGGLGDEIKKKSPNVLFLARAAASPQRARLAARAAARKFACFALPFG